MKIIETDNFDRDYPNEKVVMRNLTSDQAEYIADAINKVCSGPSAQRFWKVEEEDYKAQLGLED